MSLDGDKYNNQEPPHQPQDKSLFARVKDWYARYGKWRLFFTTLVILSALLVLVVLLMHESYARFHFGDVNMRLVSVTDTSVRARDADGHYAVLTRGGGDLSNRMSANRAPFVITYRNRTLTRAMEQIEAQDKYVYTFFDGTQWYTPMRLVLWGDDSDLSPTSARNRAEREFMQQMIRFHRNNRTIGNYVAIVVGGMFFLVYGLLIMFFQVMWKLRIAMLLSGDKITALDRVIHIFIGIFFVAYAFILVITSL